MLKCTDTESGRMEKDTLKKLAVVFITVVVIAMFITIPVLYYVADAPPIVIVVAAAVYISLAAVMAYYAHERLKEIEEGLDDAVDNY